MSCLEISFNNTFFIGSYKALNKENISVNCICAQLLQLYLYKRG